MFADTLPPPPFCQIEIARDVGPETDGEPKLGFTLGLCGLQGFAALLIFWSDAGWNGFFPNAGRSDSLWACNPVRRPSWTRKPE